jgi:hypothetical protein
LHDLAKSINQLNALRKTGLPARPNELAEAAAIRRKALEVGKHYQNVVDVEIKSVRSMLNDFDALFAAAMTGERDLPEPESLKLVEEPEEPEEPEEINEP